MRVVNMAYGAYYLLGGYIGLSIVRAGGGAGMFSGIIGGWSASGERGSAPVTKEVKE